MIYTDPTGKRVTRDQAMFAGRMRQGFSAIVEDGERVRMQPGDYLGFNIDMVDSRASRSSVYLTDSKPTLEQRVETARRQRMADKANAYRGNRTVSVPAPVRSAPMPSPTPAPASRSLNDAQAHARIEDARRAWLADKENAHRRGRED